MSSVEATPLEDVRLIQTAVDTWSISGCLTFETVGRLVAEMPSPAPGADIQVDLTGLIRVDSAGVALMVEWMRRARIAQYQVHWCAVPEVVLRLIRVMGVGDLLVSRSGA